MTQRRNRTPSMAYVGESVCGGGGLGELRRSGGNVKAILALFRVLFFCYSKENIFQKSNAWLLLICAFDALVMLLLLLFSV